MAGAGVPLRLLILGDSSAAGVGAPDQSAALSGQLVARLAQVRRLHWRLEAATGRTSAQALALLPDLSLERHDVALVVLGVNDVTRAVSAARWDARVRAIAAGLRDRCGVARVIWSGVPPMGQFPLLPQPLRRVLGAHAARLDAVLARLAVEGVIEHLPLDLPPLPEMMASDGFHPAPRAYALWAERLAACITQRGA